MSIACMEELQATTSGLPPVSTQHNGFSPLTHQSFNLPLKIKIEPKMAVKETSEGN